MASVVHYYGFQSCLYFLLLSDLFLKEMGYTWVKKCPLFFLSCLFLSNLFPKEMRYSGVKKCPLFFLSCLFLSNLFPKEMRYTGVKKGPLIIQILINCTFFLHSNLKLSYLLQEFFKSFTQIAEQVEIRRFWNYFKILQKFHCHLIFEQNSDPTSSDGPT